MGRLSPERGGEKRPRGEDSKTDPDHRPEFGESHRVGRAGKTEKKPCALTAGAFGNSRGKRPEPPAGEQEVVEFLHQCRSGDTAEEKYDEIERKTDEERSYYDWMGFVGNMIGVGALLLLPFMGYLLAYELCDYDASICPYMMADQLSMFFEMQGAMIGLIFLASNYYIWLSLKRIEGVEQIRMSGFVALAVLIMPIVMGLAWKMFPPPEWQSLIFLAAIVFVPMVLGRVPGLKNFTVSAFTMIKIGFLMIVVADAIWMTPHGFVATQGLATHDLELPEWAQELALMPAKNAAAFTLVFLTIVNYIMYNRAIKRGTIIWGKIDFASQFVLIFLAFSAIWTMGLMGTVRSLTRKYYHVYNLVPDFTAEAFTPTLSYSAWWITGVTIVFFAVVSFAILVTLKPASSKAEAH